MPRKKKSTIRRWPRDECVKAANDLLTEKAPRVPLVDNVGRAVLVLVLNEAGMNLDYREFDKRWKELRQGSSYAAGGGLPVVIAATETGAIEIRQSPDSPLPLDDLLEKLDEIWRGDLKKAVRLGDPGDDVCILGRDYPHVTFAQYNVAKALLELGEDGAIEKELIRKSGHSDARKILKRLAAKDGWKDVVQLAGRHGGRYRIKT
ncbi:MAG: hypothetical protein ABSE73_04220 [Planctomycetota bacterium]